jgi:hypothetical protein
MAFNVAGLSDYSNQENTDLFIQKVTLQKTAGYAQKVGGVKSSFAFHLLLTTPIVQDGDGCGYTASGDVQFTDRTLTTYALKFEDTLCLRTLEAKWTQKLLNSGQNYEDSDIPSVIMSDIADQIANKIESYDWTGTTGANFYNGIATVIETANTFTEANAAAYGTPQTAISNTTIDETLDMLMNAAIAKFPTWVGQTNVKLFVPMAVIGYYQQYLFRNNFFHFKPENIGNNEFPWIGTNWSIVGVNGLTGTGTAGTKCWMFETDNIFLGFDADSDETSARLWYSQDNDNHRYSFRLRRGWDTPYPNRFIRFSI